VLQICSRQSGLVLQQIVQGVINLFMALRKPFAQFFRDTLDVKVTTATISGRITEAVQVFGQLVIVEIFNVFLGAQHLVVLQRLPAVFLLVKGGVENNDVRVQV